MSEALMSDPAAYPTFNAFFTRALKPSVRSIDPHLDTLISPADGAISALGSIEDGYLLQAKQHRYTLLALLGGDQALAEYFRHGSFATIYLAPRDYHRVHMPYAGQLMRMTYVPGMLYSVNNLTAAHIPDLFARNERLITVFSTSVGEIAVILVGATIVGSMATTWAGTVTSRGVDRSKPYTITYNDKNIYLEKGDGLGQFQLGSTVIVLMPPGIQLNSKLSAGDAVNMGQVLARVHSSTYNQAS